MSDKQVIVTYSVLDDLYNNGSIRYIRGLPDADSSAPTVGTLDNPSDTGVPLLPTDPDPKLFSFAYKGEARMLLAKVTTTPGVIPSSAAWSLIAVPSPAYRGWNTLARDIRLQYGGVDVATNPYGVAQAGDWLYIVDYDSQKIYTLGVNELNGLPDGATYTLTQAPLDLGPGTAANLSADAKGQAIFALANGGATYLFALYITMNASYTHSPGYLVRLTVHAASGAPSYGIQTRVGLNPQEIVPGFPTTGAPTIFIPAIGGTQQAGTTNGTASVISSVHAFGAWPITATVALAGDPAATPPTAHDFHAIAAPARADDNGVVYILNVDYNASYSGSDWELYQTTVSGLLNVPTGTQISNAGFTVVDRGSGDPGYFWEILYENGAAAVNDRLVFFKGSPIYITDAGAYGSPSVTAGPYKYYDLGNALGQIGGQNVDWADLTSETLRQAASGVSLKHATRISLKAAARAALAAKTAGEEEK